MKRDLIDFADDFEWRTGIPLAAVISALSIVISIIAIVIALSP